MNRPLHLELSVLSNGCAPPIDRTSFCYPRVTVVTSDVHPCRVRRQFRIAFVLQNEYPVAIPLSPKIRGNENHSGPVCSYAAHDLVDFLFAADIHASCWFIKQKHRDVPGQAFAEHHLLLVST